MGAGSTKGSNTRAVGSRGRETGLAGGRVRDVGGPRSDGRVSGAVAAGGFAEPEHPVSASSRITAPVLAVLAPRAFQPVRWSTAISGWRAVRTRIAVQSDIRIAMRDGGVASVATRNIADFAEAAVTPN